MLLCAACPLIDAHGGTKLRAEMTRVRNFNAGPACLPLPALELAQKELIDFQGTGMSIMEHSHRGADYEALHAETKGLVKEHAK